LIKREDEELEKEIVLGDRPDSILDTGHVADDLIGGKSRRRDGFSLVVSHDAVLYPEKCGGPVFDIKGNFLGINIARKSRTRCFVIPKTIVKQFVDSSGL
jgi:serine protease Do